MLNALLRRAFLAILGLRYRIVIEGLAELPPKDERGMLFLPNHPALIDPFILLCVVTQRFSVRPLAGRGQIERPFVQFLAGRVQVKKIPDATESAAARRPRVAAVLRDVTRGLRRGEAWLVYPAGRLAEGPREVIGEQGGVAFLLEHCRDVRVILVRTSGLFGSVFSRASGTTPTVTGALRSGLRRWAKSGLFFCPRRQVTLHFEERQDVPRGAGRAAINRYLERFYNAELEASRDTDGAAALARPTSHKE